VVRRVRLVEAVAPTQNAPASSGSSSSSGSARLDPRPTATSTTPTRTTQLKDSPARSIPVPPAAAAAMTTAVSPAEIPVPAGDALWRALEADEMDDDAADERLLELSMSSRLSIDGEPDLILLFSLLVVEGKEDDYRALQHEIQVCSRRRPGRLRSALLPLLT
jgi:hypothetical protein